MTAGARMARDKLFFAIFKIFSGFHVDFWIATYFLSREKFICGSNNFVKICDRFFRFEKLSNKEFQKILRFEILLRI